MMTADQLRTTRERLGMTQGALADALELSREAVASWEQGRRPINKVTALAVEYLAQQIKTKKARNNKRKKEKYVS
jgi:DNA-binding transcriptional regulator YiaG